MATTKAIAEKAFPGAPDGSAYPEQFEKGDPVEGNLADVAIEQKWARPAKDEAEFDKAVKARAARLAPPKADEKA